MTANCALVVTSIAAPHAVLRSLAAGAVDAGWQFIVAGDAKSPAVFELAGCRYFSLEAQRATGLAFAAACPVNHYARKNIAYLIAMRDGATCIVETDDDNIPQAAFFDARRRQHDVAIAEHRGWVNAYRWFSDDHIWPRGFPLDAVLQPECARAALPRRTCDCPIQQGLADANPDVDAVYRLTQPLPRNFAALPAVAVGAGSWCPFNSQNTTWFAAAFPLLYLPATCSFRMTDIWRSFVAQRIAWANAWPVLFHEATVRQERNAHDIMRDFADELPGYLHNRRLAEALARVEVVPGEAQLANNLRACYSCLADLELVAPGELALLEAWLADVAAVGG